MKEDQTFSPSDDLAPYPFPPLFPITKSCLSFSVFLCVTGRAYWELERGGAGGGGGGEGEGAKSYDSEKARSSIIVHLILSA